MDALQGGFATAYTVPLFDLGLGGVIGVVRGVANFTSLHQLLDVPMKQIIGDRRKLYSLISCTGDCIMFLQQHS